MIHTTDRVGVAKTASAKAAIEALNPDVNVVEHNTRLDASNILELIEAYDVIVDGADNFPTRYLLNDATVRLRKPVVSASILGFEGQISTFIPYEGPCYRCLYPTPPPPELAPSCGANGVLGVMAGLMGLLQANEVVKLVVGIGDTLSGRLLLYDSLGTTFTELKVRRDPACPICGEDAPEIPVEEMGKFPDYELFCGAPAREPSPCSRSRFPPVPSATVKIPPVLRSQTGGEAQVPAEGSTVGDVLSSLVDAHPDTKGQLFSEDGELNRYVNVYLNDEDVRVLDGLETAIDDGDTVVILPAMAGGR